MSFTDMYFKIMKQQVGNIGTAYYIFEEVFNKPSNFFGIIETFLHIMREAFKASLPLVKEHFERESVHRLFADHYEMLVKGLLNHYLDRDQDDIG